MPKTNQHTYKRFLIKMFVYIYKMQLFTHSQHFFNISNLNTYKQLDNGRYINFNNYLSTNSDDV